MKMFKICGIPSFHRMNVYSIYRIFSHKIAQHFGIVENSQFYEFLEFIEENLNACSQQLLNYQF